MYPVGESGGAGQRQGADGESASGLLHGVLARGCLGCLAAGAGDECVLLPRKIGVLES